MGTVRPFIVSIESVGSTASKDWLATVAIDLVLGEIYLGWGFLDLAAVDASSMSKHIGAALDSAEAARKYLKLIAPQTTDHPALSKLWRE